MSRKYGDLSGKKFGYLTIIDRVQWDGREKWNYICECGKKGIVYLSNLVRLDQRAEIRSCGCGPRKKANFFRAGDVYHKWTLIEPTDCPSHIKQKKRHQRPWWICKCECGSVSVKNAYELKRGKSKSCSCYGIKKRSVYANINTIYPQKHGLKKEVEIYSLWQSLLRKCTNEGSEFYNLYGAKGITLCEDWLEAKPFINWAMQTRPGKNHCIEIMNGKTVFSPETTYWIPKDVKISRTKLSKNYFGDMIGKKYGMLTVVGEKHKTIPSGWKKLFKICLCDCGRHVEVYASDLLNRKRTSCGCKGKKYEWSINFESCSNCGRTDSACTERKTGLCEKCYHHIKIQRKKDYKPSDWHLGRQWSMKYKCCRICKTTEIKHHHHGFCKKCGVKIQNNQKSPKLRIERSTLLSIFEKKLEKMKKKEVFEENWKKRKEFMI